MKTALGTLCIFFLGLTILLQVSCNKDTDPLTQVTDPQTQVKNHPIVGKWLFAYSKHTQLGSSGSSGAVPDPAFMDTMNVQFIDSSNFIITWAKSVYYSQPPVVEWGKKAGTYTIKQDSILDVLPKDIFGNPFYGLLMKGFITSNDSNPYSSTFRIVNQDKLIIASYYPKGATAANYTKFDSVFFTRSK